MTIPYNFDGMIFAQKFGLDVINDFWIDENVLVCPSLPNLTEADIADCVVNQNHGISPQMPIVEAGQDVLITITGAPLETVILDINGDTLDVTLDDAGKATEVLVPPVAGEYVIKDGYGNIAIIKAV